MATTVGLVVNPAAGRDIRRLTGGASVSNNYAKRRTAGCVLAGLGVCDDIDVRIMPDNAGLASRIVEDAPDGLDIEPLEMPVSASNRDSRNAAARFNDIADAVVVLGGDGTTRDVAQTIGDVPVVSISTGTNNVVPTPVDGTVAGAAAAFVATGVVPADEATMTHGTVVAEVDDNHGEDTIRGLATVGVLADPFIGTRAILDPSHILGGVVSRASPTEIGISGIAGALVSLRPDEPGGVGFRLSREGTTETVARAITVPGVLSRIDVADYRVLEAAEPYTFEVERGVVSVDGEREREVTEGHISLRPESVGPRLVEIDTVVERAAREGHFVE
ncbi:NAD(+)/NADH kinase [Haloferax namakaokahaiae]|uniref:NAD(+)/NADH kinase n=1 Tax=Haloferax namakaokahaiae TaxID=1748331 RepID=A0ABD5ZGT5_9EURY